VWKRNGRIVGVDVDRVLQLAEEARDRVYRGAADRGYRPAWARTGTEVTT